LKRLAETAASQILCLRTGRNPFLKYDYGYPQTDRKSAQLHYLNQHNANKTSLD